MLVKTLKSVNSGGVRHPSGTMVDLPEKEVIALERKGAVEKVIIPVETEDKSENEQFPELNPDQIMVYLGATPEQAAILVANGYDTVKKIQDSTDRELIALDKIGDATASKLIKNATDLAIGKE